MQQDAIDQMREHLEAALHVLEYGDPHYQAQLKKELQEHALAIRCIEEQERQERLMAEVKR